MNGMLMYLCAQLKRMMKTLTRQAVVNLLMCLCVGVLAAVFIQESILKQDDQKYRIGVVGDMSDSYLGFGINAIQSMDDSR